MALAGRVLQPPLARSTLGEVVMEHGRTIETGWCSPPSRPWPRPMATWTGRPVRRNSPEAVSHGVESVACRPSVSDAQSSSGREGRKLPRRRRAGVFPIRLHTLPATTRPSPGSAIAAHAGFASAQGARGLPWIGRECYAVDRKDSCAASAGAGPMRVVLGPGRSYTKCSSPRPWWPDCGRSG